MTSIDKAVTAKLSKQGLNFEILVDCEKAIELKQGANIDVNDIVASGLSIFKDVKKGEHASDADLKRIFNTDNKQEIIKKIIKDGEVQLTKEYRDKVREEKRLKIINLIHRNSINPTNNLPHPAQRIEAAMEEAKVKIDEFKKAEDQVKEIVDKIKVILPIRFEIRELQIRIPAQFAGKSYSTLKQYGTILKDEWQNDGSLLTLLEIPAGLQTELFDRLNSLTHGEVESKIIHVK